MELTQLRLFIAAAEAESLSAAARSFYISHSTLSRAIASLESELGVTLAERGRKGFLLTAEGRRILPEAKKIIELAEGLKAIATGPTDDNTVHDEGKSICE